MTRFLRITALILAGEMIYGHTFQIPRFFRPTMLEAFDITNTQLGDMFAVFGVTAMFSYFFGGPFADKYSARSLIVVSLVLTAIGGIYMATFPGIWGMSALFGYWGVTTSFLFWAALIKATRDWGGTTSQGLAFGILDGGRGLAAAIFAVFAVWILAYYLPTETELITDDDRRAGLRAIIFYYSFIAFFCAGIIWILVPHDTASVDVQRNPFAGVMDVIRRPLIWAQSAVIICAYCGYKGLDNYALYAVQVLGMNEVEAAVLATYGAYVRPFACVIAGLFADRFNSARTIVTLFVMLVASFGILSVTTPDTTTLVVIYANLFVTYFGVFGLRGIYYALLAETNTPKHLTGRSIAIIAFVGYTPEIFFAPIAGRILDASPGVQGHLNLFAFLTATSAAGILVTAVLIWQKKKQRQSQTSLTYSTSS